MYLKYLNLIKKHLQFIKFSLVGVSNTLISLISYTIIVKLGLYYIVANVLAYGVGMVNSFILNKRWVFKSKNSVGTTAVKFILVNLGALSASTFLLYLCVSIIGLNKILAQIVVTLLVLIINFSANKLWSFRTR
ncbi:GtrA family protein [Clostridium magnum]|uniref:GtrA-like protein n=1 Tax=Clostridium magnum DSM 2767 TaxID=1121326 RepID=A0A161X0J8_9CLOT|nr:GtrA family protein [Clostridium magnum]KZL92968.1 GtrA-like protein [Clostridium magnum DSM 2767]SHJ21659.1 Putative flippase GtrA (transmembrane translocase of bactoprenol-linked glucose) [Clostridium magnum DSM 2767]